MATCVQSLLSPLPWPGSIPSPAHPHRCLSLSSVVSLSRSLSSLPPLSPLLPPTPSHLPRRPLPFLGARHRSHMSVCTCRRDPVGEKRATSHGFIGRSHGGTSARSIPNDGAHSLVMHPLSVW